MTFGQKIKYLRNQKNLTQKELAEKMNVTFQTISKWESDTNEPDIESIRMLSKIFDCSLDYLFDNEKGNDDTKPQYMPVPVQDNVNSDEAKDEKKEIEIAKENIQETKQVQPKDVNEEQEATIPSEDKSPSETENYYKPKFHSFTYREDFKSLLASIICSIIILILCYIALGLNANLFSIPAIIFLPILFAYMAFADVYCIFSGSYITEAFLSIATKSIHFPGLIFSFSADGPAWLIGMKILFFVLSIFFSVLFIFLALLVATFLSFFSCIPLLIRNSI